MKIILWVKQFWIYLTIFFLSFCGLFIFFNIERVALKALLAAHPALFYIPSAIIVGGGIIWFILRNKSSAGTETSVHVEINIPNIPPANYNPPPMNIQLPNNGSAATPSNWWLEWLAAAGAAGMAGKIFKGIKTAAKLIK